MRSLATAALLLMVIYSTPQADTFEDAGLGPTACRLVEYDRSSVREAVDLLKSLGARSLQVFPHGVIFGMMPGAIGNGLPLDLAASFYRSPEEFRAGCPDLDEVILLSMGNLLQGDEYRRCLLDSAGEAAAMRIESGSLPHPDQDDILGSMMSRKYPRAEAGGRKWPTQNSEFLIGSVLINVVFPQGSSLVETWTEDEFAQVISSISIGLSELQQYTHWIDLVFYFNYSDFRWVPVDVEPSRTHWYDHEDWLTEALTSLGYPGLDSYIGTFELNNDTRAEFGTDWVFTAYIADMSDNWDEEMTYYDPRCWGGWSDEHESRSPVSYAYIGGPYLVVSHPACWLDYGVGFYRVFMHEMFHIFWAWDEYCGESCCNVRTGYFNTINWNV
ncbi:MAG TPA: hypothetical protein VLA34_00365, partial [Candidatus Krumholzibacterium sp.]|nr:hypothetical protein [Candidatus Krumholzibacterium sp.]